MPWLRTAGLNLFEAVLASGELLQDFFHAGSPNKGRRIGVPRAQELLDGSLQLFHIPKGTATNSLFTQFSKPSLDQIQPTGTGRNEVQHKARMFGQLAAHAFMSMGAVVVHDQMQLHFAGKLGIQAAQELQKFLVTMTRIALANDTPFKDMKCGE